MTQEAGRSQPLSPDSKQRDRSPSHKPHRLLLEHWDHTLAQIYKAVARSFQSDEPAFVIPSHRSRACKSDHSWGVTTGATRCSISTFYIDPPYLLETRGKGRYNHELTAAGLEKLLAVLRGLAGMVMLSGHPSPLYDRALCDWRRLETESLAEGGRERTEVLWLNPAAAAAFEAERLPLFQNTA